MKRYLLDDFPYFSDETTSAHAGANAGAPLVDDAKQPSTGITPRDFTCLMASLGAAAIADTMGFIPWRCFARRSQLRR